MCKINNRPKTWKKNDESWHHHFIDTRLCYHVTSIPAQPTQPMKALTQRRKRQTRTMTKATLVPQMRTDMSRLTNMLKTGLHPQSPAMQRWLTLKRRGSGTQADVENHTKAPRERRRKGAKCKLLLTPCERTHALWVRL